MASFDLQTPLQFLYNQAKAISKNVFVVNRPTSVSESMSDFVVVSLPTRIMERTIGYDDYAQQTTGRIMIFVRDLANGTQNIAKTQTLLSAAKELFPMSNENVKCYRPTIINTGSDDNGFHTITIQFDLLIV
jgi:hypothetical protein